MRVMHLVPAQVTDFVRKDVEYLQKTCGIDACIQKVGWSGRRTVFQSLLSIIRMVFSALIIWKKKPDVVHAHFLFSTLSASLCGVPAVATIHESVDGLPPFWRILFKICSRRCNLVFVSNHSRNLWRPVLDKDGVVIYHAIDLGSYSRNLHNEKLRNSLLEELEVEHLIFCMAGLYPDRGIHVAVKAVAELQKEGANVGLIIKGYGGSEEYESYLERLIGRLGVPAKTITSHLTDEEIAELFASSDVYIRSTFSESFGIAPLEAQACGTPVIVTNCCSLKEIFADSALMFERGDHMDLAIKISQILSDSDLRNRLIESGFRNAESFTWESKIQKYVGLYLHTIRS